MSFGKQHVKYIGFLIIIILFQLLFIGEFIQIKVNNINHTRTARIITFPEPVAAVSYDEAQTFEEKTYFELINPIDAPPNVAQMLTVDFTEDYESVNSPTLHLLPKLNEFLNTSDKDWYFSGLAYKKPYFWTLEWREVTVDLDQKIFCFSLENSHFSNHTLSTSHLDTSKLHTFFRTDIEFGEKYLWTLEHYSLRERPEIKYFNISAYSSTTYQLIKTFQFPKHKFPAEPILISYDGEGRIWIDISGTTNVNYDLDVVAFSLEGYKTGEIWSDRLWPTPDHRESWRIVENHIMFTRLTQIIFRGDEISNIAGFKVHFLERKPVSLPFFVAEVSSIVVVLAWVGYTIYGKYKKKKS